MIVQTSAEFARRFSEPGIEISYSGYVTTDEKWRQPPLPTHISRLYYVEEGAGMLVSPAEEMALEPGYVYLAPCGTPCGYYGTDAVTRLFFHIRVPGADGRDAFSGCGRFVRIPFSVERIRRMTACYFNGELTAQLELKREIFDTVCRFLRDPLCTLPAGPTLSEPVIRAMEYIQKNRRANLTVREVADACFVSPALLARLFREQMYTGVARYIEELLMLEARRRLSEGDSSIGEISEALGYCDQFYFSRRFSALFGISPREYRKNRSYT